MTHLPLSTFRRCVAAHRGDHKVQEFSCLDQFFAMAFAQFAVCTYVLIAIVKKRLKLSHSLYEILQILSLTIFETTPINQLLPNPSANSEPPITPIQGVLL